MRLELSDNLIKQVINLRKANIPFSELEKYEEVIAVLVDRLLRWAIYEILGEGKE